MYKQNYLLQVAYSKPVSLHSNSDKMGNFISGKNTWNEITVKSKQ